MFLCYCLNKGLILKIVLLWRERERERERVHNNLQHKDKIL